MKIRIRLLLAIDPRNLENVDIGGPAMLRSAAKNHESVTVVTDPNDYAEVAAQIKVARRLSIMNQETELLVFERAGLSQAANMRLCGTGGTAVTDPVTLTCPGAACGLLGEESLKASNARIIGPTLSHYNGLLSGWSWAAGHVANRLYHAATARAQRQVV